LKSTLLFSLLLFGFVACGPAPDMPKYNQGTTFEMLDSKDEKNFFKLPLAGEVKNGERYWSGDYWALNRGNINYRWNSDNKEGFDYDSPTREELLFMSPESIAELSPTEKFDIYLGRYNYPLKEEVYTVANKHAQSWEGICNGWAPATVNHNEPVPKTVRNADGVEIRFGSSDIKALLSYYYAFVHKVENTQQLGRRCPKGSRWFNWDEDCKNDLDAGSFHIVMANKVGLQNHTFMVDIERYKEVWNHPILSYVSTIENESAAKKNNPEGTVKVVQVKSTVTYVHSSTRNTWEPVRGTTAQRLTKREYVYDIYLDQNNHIISGNWVSQDRPDFLWTMSAAQEFKGLMNGLGRLLND
jgi:hypothetical protein